MIKFGIATTPQDLQSILDLQKVNLPAHISAEEAISQGFLTVDHDFDLLEKMNTPFPHIIAKVDNEVVGYTLVMLRKWKNVFAVLVSMFDEINKIEYENVLLQDASYFVMGQVCVAKDYRGKGVFAGLYQEMKTRMKNDFDYIITEVATRNTRSMNAHSKVGFKSIKIYTAENGEEWAILILHLKY